MLETLDSLGPKLNIWKNNSLRRMIRFQTSLCFYQHIIVCSSQSRHSSSVTVCNLGQKKQRLHSPTRDKINIKTGIIICWMLQTWILIVFYFSNSPDHFRLSRIRFLMFSKKRREQMMSLNQVKGQQGGWDSVHIIWLCSSKRPLIHCTRVWICPLKTLQVVLTSSLTMRRVLQPFPHP